ncbi:cellulose synthase like E1 [Hibiscus trionum]|uniref:Cellulose synthase like E1 n=1 Tax=Hibiscus trionum TaxID=183268 RepID=A0A9W7HXZ8_HIBTR|nr:cellulose synthase like E1 [Hibiscus trionum]
MSGNQISSPWVLPFAYVSIAHRAYSLGEFLWCGGTFQTWCNEQRMWLFKRTTSYFFAFFDTVLKLLGYLESAFVITPKVADRDVSRRYEQELMEFGDSSPTLDVLASLAMLNMFGMLGIIKKLASGADRDELSDRFGLQILLCSLLVALNWPVYKAMFYRKDKGRMSASVTCKSIIYALLVSTLAL